MKYYRETGGGFEFSDEIKSFHKDYHCHSRIEFLYVKRGTIRLRTDMGRVVYDVYEGDYAVIKSADVHRIYIVGEACVETIWLPVSYQNLFNEDFVRTSFVIPADVVKDDTSLNNIVTGIFSYLSRAKANDSLVRSFCSTLCSVFLSLYSKRRTVQSVGNDSSERIVVDESNVNMETMNKFDSVITYINENYTNSKISLEYLSNVSGLNKTFLSVLFPRLTGRNFKDYIHYLRINHAIEQLTTTDKKISDIAFSCGFETIRSFNNVFKCVVGTTPSGFVNSLSGKDGGGIDTVVIGEGKHLFKYNWTCNVDYVKNFEEEKICVTCNDTALKLWCHLRLRMLFHAGCKYKVSYKARVMRNSIGTESIDKVLRCNFYFKDEVINIEHHSPMIEDSCQLDDGWYQFSASYTVPDYYKPSTDDNFSVYSTPIDDLGVSYEVKDIILTKE